MICWRIFAVYNCFGGHFSRDQASSFKENDYRSEIRQQSFHGFVTCEMFEKHRHSTITRPWRHSILFYFGEIQSTKSLPDHFHTWYYERASLQPILDSTAGMVSCFTRLLELSRYHVWLSFVQLVESIRNTIKILINPQFFENLEHIYEGNRGLSQI